jgi:hypothetical protein
MGYSFCSHLWASFWNIEHHFEPQCYWLSNHCIQFWSRWTIQVACPSISPWLLYFMTDIPCLLLGHMVWFYVWWFSFPSILKLFLLLFQWTPISNIPTVSILMIQQPTNLQILVYLLHVMFALKVN